MQTCSAQSETPITTLPTIRPSLRQLSTTMLSAAHYLCGHEEAQGDKCQQQTSSGLRAKGRRTFRIASGGHACKFSQRHAAELVSSS